MNQPGIGSIIPLWRGGSKQSPEKYSGRKIVSASFSKYNNQVRIGFEDGVTIIITDEGQSCCEVRYMTMDDNIEDIVGHRIENVRVKSVKEKETEYEYHEIAFLEIKTDRDSVVFCTHVEHNGYYGGFSLNIIEEMGGKGK